MTFKSPPQPPKRRAAPTSPPASEAAFDGFLAVSVQAGERRASELLAKRWWPRLARAAQRLVGADRAEDAAQDALISIFRNIGTLRDPARFAPWAFGILQRRSVDIIRRSEARKPEMSELAATSSHDGAFERLAIAQAMAALPADQRFAAHLFFVEGLTLVEIAEAQAVPIGTAKSRLFHARRHLKLALSGDDQ